MVTVARHALRHFSHSSVVDKILVLSNLTLSGTATAHKTLSGARRDALEKVEEIYTLVL